MSFMRFLPAPRFALLPLLLLTVAACKEDQAGVQVKDLSFTGNTAVTTAQLKSVLATAESPKLPWGPREYFRREEFEADLKRVVAFYRDRGYPDARVRSFDVRLSDDQKSVRLTVDIEEGEPIRVERVVITGLDPIPEEHRQELDARLPLKVGEPLDGALLQASREAALDELKDHGYPNPEVKTAVDPGSSERLRVVSFNAEPGRLVYVGRIEVEGTASINDRIVRRQLTFRPGQLFQQSKLRESQRRLYSMELFNFVNVEAVTTVDIATASVETVGPENAADRIPTRVTVTEGKHRKVNFGLGYGTEEKARGEIDWRHVNFFGGARTAGVFARYSAIDRGVRLNFRQPYFFNPRYSFGLSGQSWFSNELAYELTTVGGRATVTREFTRSRSVLAARQTTTLALTYVNEWEDYTISDEARADPTFRDELIALGLDPETGSDKGQLSSLMLDAGRNTTGNLLDAKKGYVAIVHLETAGRFLGGDFDYHEISAEGRFYQSLGDRVVVAVRGRAGSIDSSGPEDELVPFFKRYFLGGSTNLRGWGRYEVSPLSGEGNPIGGHSFVNFSTEVRVPIVGKFGAVLFLDGGNVWTNPWNLNLNDLRYDAGPGLRYNTPIGPVRLDVGWQLNPIPGLLVNGAEQKRPLRVHFSIGQAF
jgi:outer membrane protein insertion porin family/translocation and assembly module TamA